jgi:glycerophosphoryl diester phosphodiesterase
LTDSKISRPVIIAHRGASAYLPEHTLEAKAVAHAMGADYIEQDVVLSRDGVPIVLHDIYLDSTTDVAERFGDRARADGRYYALDFSLEEIRQLRVMERARPGDPAAAYYPGRFPRRPGPFRVPTLAEEIDLIAGMDRSRDRETGLYLEFKAPRWHGDQGYDPVDTVLSILDEKGYADRPERVYLQCFDDATLRRLRHEQKVALPLIQLIADNSWGEDSSADFDEMRTESGIADIASYADGIGPWVDQIYLGRAESGQALISDLVALAHRHHLLVHPYTLRSDELPGGISCLEELLDILVQDLGVDGIFTDFPDTVRDYLAGAFGEAPVRA